MSESPLPSEQFDHDGLERLSERELLDRRERVFLALAGMFLGTLAMLNIVGITRFLDLSLTIPGLGLTIPMPVAVGVLPYPITFLCTDFISELFGRRRANQVVLMGLVLNLWVVFVLWLGGVLPGVPNMDDSVFFGVRAKAFAAVTASMIAYLAAQLIDVQLFHFWKRLTRGRHLWLRNNGSTMVSQLVDTVAVILITHFFAGGLGIPSGESVAVALLTYIAAGYVFKLVVAALDTIPFYLGTSWLIRYLRLPPPYVPEVTGDEPGTAAES